MESVPTDEQNRAFEAVLDYLKESGGFDFTGYKRTSLARRVNRRMTQVGIVDYAEYVDYLQVNPEEFIALFNTILINVTGFFRDTDTWEYLRAEVISAILAERGGEDPIRIWSAGCASGEEAYSLAILFAEAMGVDQFRARVKIYATDVDDEALTQARHASYGEREAQGIGRSCWTSTSSTAAAGTSSARTCAGRSSSAATTWCRTPRSPGSTCWCAATR